MPVGLGLSRTFFTPSALQVVAYWKAGFGGTPWVPEGKTQSVGNLVGAGGGANPTAGTKVISYAPANFSAASSQYFTGPSTSALFGGGVGSFFCLFYANRALSPYGPRWYDGNILTDAGHGEVAFGFTSSGFCVSLLDNTGVNQRIDVPASVGQWHLAQARWDGSNLYARIDDGPWLSTPCSSVNITSSASTIYVGRDFGSNGTNKFFDGQILELGIGKATFATTDFDDILKYCRSRYGLSLKNDPSSLNLSGYWRSTWTSLPETPIRSAGGSGINGNLTTSGFDPSFGNGPGGSLVNSYNTMKFTAASTQFVNGPSTTLLFSTTGSFFCLFYSNNTPTTTGITYADGTLFSDPTNAETTFGFTSSGLSASILDNVGYKRLNLTNCKSGTWNLAQFKWDGTNLYGRVNDEAWTSTACGPLTFSVPGGINVGRSYGGNIYFDGHILEVGTSQTVLSDSDFDNILQYCRNRYDLHLTVNPFNFSSIQWWVDSLTGVTTLGGPDTQVTAWNDQTAGAHNLTNGTTALYYSSKEFANSTIPAVAGAYSSGVGYMTLSSNLTITTNLTAWMVIKNRADVNEPAGNSANPPATIFGDSTGTSNISIGFSAGTPSYNFKASTTYSEFLSSRTNIDDDQCHTICWTHTSGTLKCYIDGELTDTFTSGVSSGGGIGSFIFNTLSAGAALVDNTFADYAELGLFNAVLSDTDIRRLHNRAVNLWFPGIEQKDDATITGMYLTPFNGAPWLPARSAGTSFSAGNLTNSNGTTTKGTAMNGWFPASFGGSNALISSTGAFLHNGNIWSIAVLFKVSSVVAANATSYLDAAIFCGAAGSNRTGIYVNNTNTLQLNAVYWNGTTAYACAVDGLTIGKLYLATMSYVSGTIYFNITGGALGGNSVVTTGNMPNDMTQFYVGRNNDGSKFFNGEVFDIFLSDNAGFDTRGQYAIVAYAERKYNTYMY